MRRVRGTDQIGREAPVLLTGDLPAIHIRLRERFETAGLRVRSVSICTFVPVKQVNYTHQTQRALRDSGPARARVRSVSICTFVPVRAQRQYLYFCTSKASKLSTVFVMRGSVYLMSG